MGTLPQGSPNSKLVYCTPDLGERANSPILPGWLALEHQLPNEDSPLSRRDDGPSNEAFQRARVRPARRIPERKPV